MRLPAPGIVKCIFPGISTNPLSKLQNNAENDKITNNNYLLILEKVFLSRFLWFALLSCCDEEWAAFSASQNVQIFSPDRQQMRFLSEKVACSSQFAFTRVNLLLYLLLLLVLLKVVFRTLLLINWFHWAINFTERPQIRSNWKMGKINNFNIFIYIPCKIIEFSHNMQLGDAVESMHENITYSRCPLLICV